MFWLKRKQLQAFLKNSLWVVPVFSMLAAIVAAPIIRILDHRFHPTLLDFGIQGARATVGLIAASMLSFVVFFFSVLLVTVQIASGNLSPRIIVRPFQSKVLKTSLGLFVFTFIYGVCALARLEDRVHQLPVFIMLVLSLISLGTFLFVVEHVGKQLRPATVLAQVAQEGIEVIRSVYPHSYTGESSSHPLGFLPKTEPVRVLPHEGRGGVVVAFHLEMLVALAAGEDYIIEFVPQVGDFVAFGAPLFRIYGRAPVRTRQLYESVAFGRERTLEQDPAFAFRIIVDIADKALSAAINDPTTAVLAIDQVQRLLQEVGQRNLGTGVASDDRGAVRLVYRTPNWNDFALLAVAEIRSYGAASLQVMRRMRGMLESLIDVLPAARVGLLQQQLELLRLSVEKAFSEPMDRAQAEIPDSQGLGGPLDRTEEDDFVTQQLASHLDKLGQ